VRLGVEEVRFGNAGTGLSKRALVRGDVDPGVGLGARPNGSTVVIEVRAAALPVLEVRGGWVKDAQVCVYYCSTYYKAVRVGGGG
jgi:hypothetical protein